MLTVPILTLLAGVKSGEINETLEAKRRDFAIEEKQVDALTWTPEGTVRSTQERPFVRGKTQIGCSEEIMYGLYDFDCSRGKRKIGQWTKNTRCRLYCLSSQAMEPAVKQLRCTYHRPTQRYIWKGAARQGNRRVLLSDPRVDCITMNNVARWGAWGPWSSWTQCSRECGTGEKIRQRRRVCVGGVMGENDQCPHNGNVQLEYGGCDNQCVAPPSTSVSFSEVKDKGFIVNWETENIDQSDIGHFKVEVFESIVNWNQESYKVANLDMIHPSLRDISVWREVKPLTRYDVWVWMMDNRGQQLADPTIAKVFTLGSRFDFDEDVMCAVDWPTTHKDEMLTSCDHLQYVPAGHRCYTYCKDDWKKIRGTEYITCMNGKWRGSWPKCEPRGWRCNMNMDTYCPGCIRPDNCCDFVTNDGDIDYICKQGYLRPETNGPGKQGGIARGLMKKLKADGPSCATFRHRRRDCSLTYAVKVLALYTDETGRKDPIERILVDVATDTHFTENCIDDADYDVKIMDVRPQAGYSHVQIVFEAELNRYDGNLGYDMWFDDFEHGYGRCSVMRCGEFPPPLLKGGGATFGHDVALENTCTDGDNAHSVCQMNCPTTHPVHHFAHYWQEIICNPSGFWNQPLYTYYTGYCQAPSCNYFDIIPPKNGWYSCSDEGYEGSVCTFGCNSVDYTLNSKAPYRIQCRNGKWNPIGGKSGFIKGQIQADCVFNHVFARRERRISQSISPLHAMRMQYRELAGLDHPSFIRKERTKHNVEMARKKFGFEGRSMNFDQIYHAEMNGPDFEEMPIVAFEGK